jgi:hypothetical protein
VIHYFDIQPLVVVVEALAARKSVRYSHDFSYSRELL